MENGASGSEVVEYDLDGWSQEARDSLEFLLVDAGVNRTWASSRLRVPQNATTRVDALVEYLTTGEDAQQTTAAVVTEAPPVEPPAPVAPGAWYPDPWDIARLRWWDGSSWTGWTDGVASRPWFPRRGSPDRSGAIKGGGIAIAGFVLAVLASFVAGFLAWLGGVPREPVDSVLVVGQVALWAVMFGTCLLTVRRNGTGSLSDLGLRGLRWRDLGIGLIAGFSARIAVGILILPLIPLVRGERVAQNAYFEELHDANLVALIVVTLIVVAGAAFFEELFFRGLVQGVLTRRWGPRIAVWVQAVIFASIHLGPRMSLGQVLITLVAIGTVGLLLGAMRFHYDRLGPGILTHATFNLIALAIAVAVASS